MPFADLQQFIRFLEGKGQLKRIRVEVDPELEVTEITQRVIREHGPALLFVHGFPLDHTMWQAQLSQFAGGHRVVAPDVRGFGASEAG